MNLSDKDFNLYPKFRHNLWITHEETPEFTILTVSNGDFEVSTKDAKDFLNIRSHCTGYNTIDDIAKKSGISAEEVKRIIKPLIAADILHLPITPLQNLSNEQVINTLVDAAKIWGDQLAETSIAREIFYGRTSKNVVLGWLLETYHYIKNFPDALEIATKNSSGDLQKILLSYTKEERGHEEFIAQTLVKAGLSREEVEGSVPLVSTRTINLLLKDLFAFEPIAVFIVASIIEAADFDEDTASEVSQILADRHKFPIDLLNPFFEHVKVDSKLGHQKLLEDNIQLLKNINREKLHDVVNKIHDIKHAFDLQKLEIKDYYEKLGNYFPRQKVDFFAI